MSEAKQLFIPDRINVGFQERGDTYTGKLAYVIYFDQKGKLRKEKSWRSWCKEELGSQELKNEPLSGFVLNKGVGGARRSYGWNARNEYIRVYDPRDFEFEISVANLLFILRECDCSRGKGLEGEFVYAWEGTELVLLPTGCEDYKNSVEFTDLKAKKVMSKDLIEGASYTTKDQRTLVFMGRREYHFVVHPNGRTFNPKKDEEGVHKRKYVWWNGNDFEFTNDVKSIAVLQSDAVAPNYAELVDQYYQSKHGTPVVELFAKEDEDNKSRDPRTRADWYFQDADGAWVQCYDRCDYREPSLIEHIQANYCYHIDDKGRLVKERRSGQCFSKKYREKNQHRHSWSCGRYAQDTMAWVEPTNLVLYARLESGAEFRVTELTCRGGY